MEFKFNLFEKIYCVLGSDIKEGEIRQRSIVEYGYPLYGDKGSIDYIKSNNIIYKIMFNDNSRYPEYNEKDIFKTKEELIEKLLTNDNNN